MQLPDYAPYVIIGGGIHGLSTAWHLAKDLKARGRGSGEDIIVLDKSHIGAGASGIACGVVRNFYFAPAMTQLIKICVDVWESDPEAFGYESVGYLAAVPESQTSDLEAIAERQEDIGYESDLFIGERKCQKHMDAVFPDFNCDGLNAVLHEYQGGFANAMQAVRGLARKARKQDVDIRTGVRVTRFDIRAGEVHAVETDQGSIQCDMVVVGVGPWIERFWQMLDLPQRVDVHMPNGGVHRDQPMWRYMKLQEGEVHLDQPFLDKNGNIPPVIHLDHNVPLYSDINGDKITDGPWGIYWKNDLNGVQGGAVPIPLGTEVDLEPYGHENPDHTVDEDFADYFTAGLAWAMDRFRGESDTYHQRPNGGIGAFSPDSYPVFDLMRPNVYVIADSNHGFKMIGVGKEVAAYLMEGKRESLHPFRFSRYEEGDLHPSSNSPYPWN